MDDSDGLAREVVFGGAEAAGTDHEVVLVTGAAYDFHQAVQVVADRVLVVEVDAQGRQARCDVGAVGINDLAEKDFSTDGDDFSFHAWEHTARSYQLSVSGNQ